MVKNAAVEGKGGDELGSGIARLVLVCFFFSGMTGLLYQVLWTRMIVKIIGGAPFAISIILTVFMGGLGVGSYIASRRIDRIADSLKLVRLYGVLELVIGGYCLLLPLLLTAFRPLYARLYNQLFEYSMLYNLITFAGCAVLLALPVICMGATLPILCRFYVTRLSHLGGHIGRLYGLNTIGAALGALVCGFWLINYLGMTGSLVVAVGCNVAIGLVTIVASYKMEVGGERKGKIAAGEPVDVDEEVSRHGKGAAVAALVMFAVSGFCAMAYEVIWAKLLGLIIGPTTYSFTIVLVTFITGLALGSMIFGWLGDRVKKVIWLLIYTQVAAGLLALLASQVMGNSQFFFSKLIYHLRDSFWLLNLAKAGVLFGLMLLPTLCLGATFPLVGKIYTQSLAKVGRSVGSAYAINTIGAVLGSFCAGFVLIPLLGKENGLRLVVVVQIGTALVAGLLLTAINRRAVLRSALLVGMGVVAVFLCMRFPSWNREALTMGRYHRHEKFVGDIKRAGWWEALWEGAEILGRHPIGEIVYYGDGIAGFTTVLKVEDAFGNYDYSMVISGKPDASSYGDMPTQVMSAHIPMMFHANAKSVMVLGLASGVTAAEVLCYPVERLDVLEISRKVVEASDLFLPWNGGVLADERTHLILQDGRAHLQLTDRTYDVIISEPSNPWMAGLAALFTRDFFVAAKARLTEQGIFTQFIHSYQMDWATFSMVGRSFADVFPKSALFRTKGGDFLMVGVRSGEGLNFDYAKANVKFARRSENVRIIRPELIVGLLMTEDLKGLCGEGELNTDSWPRLEYAAPKAMYTVDDTISGKIGVNRRLRPVMRSVMTELASDMDARIDFAEMAFSLNDLSKIGVDMQGATPAQKKRYAELLEGYCADRKIEYSVIKDEALKGRCRIIQIESILNRIDSIKRKELAYYMLGDLYRELKQLGDAEPYYRLALELRPDHAPLHNDLAVVLHYQGRLKEAIDEYDEALRLDKDCPGSAENRQKALGRVKR